MKLLQGIKGRPVLASPRIRFELMDALAARLYTASSMKLRLRNGACLLAALFCGVTAWADEAADQLERARLLRDFHEAPLRDSSSNAAKTPSLPPAALDKAPSPHAATPADRAPSVVPPVTPDKAPSSTAATMETERLRAQESLRTQQLQDSQWRKLLGDQQMQLHQQPFPPNTSESQWRSQIFERDRQAQELSTDILRRSQQPGPAGRR